MWSCNSSLNSYTRILSHPAVHSGTGTGAPSENENDNLHQVQQVMKLITKEMGDRCDAGMNPSTLLTEHRRKVICDALIGTQPRLAGHTFELNGGGTARKGTARSGTSHTARSTSSKSSRCSVNTPSKIAMKKREDSQLKLSLYLDHSYPELKTALDDSIINPVVAVPKVIPITNSNSMQQSKSRGSLTTSVGTGSLADSTSLAPSGSLEFDAHQTNRYHGSDDSSDADSNYSCDMKKIAASAAAARSLELKKRLGLECLIKSDADALGGDGSKLTTAENIEKRKKITNIENNKHGILSRQNSLTPPISRQNSAVPPCGEHSGNGIKNSKSVSPTNRQIAKLRSGNLPAVSGLMTRQNSKGDGLLQGSGQGIKSSSLSRAPSSLALSRQLSVVSPERKTNKHHNHVEEGHPDTRIKTVIPARHQPMRDVHGVLINTNTGDKKDTVVGHSHDRSLPSSPVVDMKVNGLASASPTENLSKPSTAPLQIQKNKSNATRSSGSEEMLKSKSNSTNGCTPAGKGQFKPQWDNYDIMKVRWNYIRPQTYELEEPSLIPSTYDRSVYSSIDSEHKDENHLADFHGTEWEDSLGGLSRLGSRGESAYASASQTPRKERRDAPISKSRPVVKLRGSVQDIKRHERARQSIELERANINMQTRSIEESREAIAAYELNRPYQVIHSVAESKARTVETQAGARKHTVTTFLPDTYKRTNISDRTIKYKNHSVCEDEFISAELRQHLENHPYYKTHATTLLSAVTAPERKVPTPKSLARTRPNEPKNLNNALYNTQKNAGLMTLSQTSSMNSNSKGSKSSVIVPVYVRESNLPIASITS